MNIPGFQKNADDGPGPRYTLETTTGLISVPSVTEIIGKEDFSHIPPDVLEGGRQKGVRNHSILELEAKEEGATPENQREIVYQRNVRKFLDAWAIPAAWGKPVVIERPLLSLRYGFCGTPDLAFRRVVLDLKRSFGNLNLRALQLAGYFELLREYGLVEGDAEWYTLVVNETEHGAPFYLREIRNPYARRIFFGAFQALRRREEFEHYMNLVLN